MNILSIFWMIKKEIKKAMFSGKHLIKTNNGFIKVKELKIGDKILTVKGYCSITKII